MFRWIVTFFMLAAAILLLRNLALDSPLMPGDEYAYFAAAQTFPHSTERFDADPYLPRIHSPVFAGYGRLLNALSPRPEHLMKVLNVLAFSLSTLVYLSLLPVVGARSPSRLVAGWLLITPFTAYTAYFMPESTYGLLFSLLAWTVVRLLPQRALVAAALAGVIVGAMLLIKPHALAIVAAMVLTLATLAVAPRRMRPPLAWTMTAGAVFVLCCYVTLVTLNFLLSGAVQWHPLTFVGGVYRPVLSNGGSPLAWLERPRALITILAGHVIVLGALLSPAVAVAAGQLRSFFAATTEPAREDRHRYVLICLAGAVALTTVGMTTVFSMFVAQLSAFEHLRLHGRYYSFFMPLFFLSYFAVIAPREGSEANARHDWYLRIGAVVGVGMALMLLYLHNKRVIFPFDFPEAFVFSAYEGRPRVGAARVVMLTLRYGAVAAAVTVYSLLAWRGRRVWAAYPWLLIALFTVSNAGVSAWQRGTSRDHHTLRADARAAKALIPAASRSAGVVVGPEWNGPLAYFLFNFQSSPRVLVRDPNIPLERGGLPGDPQWIVLIGPYRTDFDDKAAWRAETLTFFDLAGKRPAGGTE